MSKIGLSSFGRLTARKKDYITVLAVILLVLIICGEVLFSIWLPAKLRSEKAWEKEALMEDNIERLDSLRGGMTSIKSKNSKLEGEIQLALKCLDEYAKYMRENKLSLSLDQAVEINRTLLDYNTLFVKWKAGISYVNKKDLNSRSFLDEIKRKIQQSENDAGE